MKNPPKEGKQVMGIIEQRAQARARREAAKAAKENANAPAAVEPEADKEAFANQPGLPANVKAKELAQAKSRKKTGNWPIFYTKKGLKVLKMIVKPGKLISVYIGNLGPKKHKAALEVMIERWKKEGIWFEEHQAKEQSNKLQASFEK
jgi:hypothetical protein